MWFRCFLLLVCLAVLLPACVTCRPAPSRDDSKSALEALLQHKVKEGIDETIWKGSVEQYCLLRGSWVRHAHTAYEISNTYQSSPPTPDAAAERSTENEEDRRYLLEFRKDYEEPGPNTNHGLDPPAPQPAAVP